MFTGLIEAQGIVASVQQTEAGSRLVIDAPETFMTEATLGESIAIDGVCTTVVAFDHQQFTIEASPETLSKTTFRLFQPGRRVNLERPLTAQARLGGHFVSGHVDDVAVVLAIEPQGNSYVFEFRLLKEELAPLLIEKGSVTVNGISLTVNWVNRLVFSVAIIPHTWEQTNLSTLAVDDLVNIETDLLGKYVMKLMSHYALGQNASSPRREGINPNTNPKIPMQAEERVGNSTIHSGVWFNLD